MTKRTLDADSAGVRREPNARVRQGGVFVKEPASTVWPSIAPEIFLPSENGTRRCRKAEYVTHTTPHRKRVIPMELP